MDAIYDVVAMGELLIDFTNNGASGQGNPLFEANPGGAPCNVLAMLAGLGRKTGFIGKVGDDFFGKMLFGAVREAGIDGSGLVFDQEVHTTLALVHNKPGGDRDFSFYRNPGADMRLVWEEVRKEMLTNTRIFHFGTLSMTHEGIREATKKAAALAKESGALLSFDPNLRPPLWQSLEDAREQAAFGFSVCDILKISDNEIQWFTGEKELHKGIQALRDSYDIPLVLLSMGKDGSRAYYQDICVEAAPFINENTIETTGAGDTFGGSCLNFVLEYGLNNLNEERLRTMLRFANGAASIVTTRRGALKVMPRREEILELIQ